MPSQTDVCGYRGGEDSRCLPRQMSVGIWVEKTVDVFPDRCLWLYGWRRQKMSSQSDVCGYMGREDSRFRPRQMSVDIRVEKTVDVFPDRCLWVYGWRTQ